MFEKEINIATKHLFRLDFTAWVLRRRDRNMLDQWDGRNCSRVVTINKNLVLISLVQLDSKNLVLKVTSKKPLQNSNIDEVKKLVSKMFGLDIDLQRFYEVARKDPILKHFAMQFIGMRPTRYPTVFEALTNAVVCQQVSLDAGLSILNRLIMKYGESITFKDKKRYCFPEAKVFIDAPDQELKAVGLSYQKTKAIKQIAYKIENADFNPKAIEKYSNQDALNTLLSLHGIGRWSAEYVLLRGLGRLEFFPGDDVGGQNNIQKIIGTKNRPNYDELKSITSTWHPYEGLVYLNLLLLNIYKKGLVKI